MLHWGGVPPLARLHFSLRTSSYLVDAVVCAGVPRGWGGGGKKLFISIQAQILLSIEQIPMLQRTETKAWPGLVSGVWGMGLRWVFTVSWFRVLIGLGWV